MDEPVHVEEWNPIWHAAADAVAAECRAVLGEQALAVEHIGSTAVRGLAAKPVIDMLIGVPSGRRSAVARRLMTYGWTHLGEAGVPGLSTCVDESVNTPTATSSSTARRCGRTTCSCASTSGVTPTLGGGMRGRSGRQRKRHRPCSRTPNTRPLSWHNY